MDAQNLQQLNEFMGQLETPAPRFQIYRLKHAEQYCPPGTPPDPVQYTYCIFDTLKNEFLQAVECCDSEDDPDLNYLCDLLNAAH